jgi:polysaccharide biosynthesis transport protein
MDNVQTNAPASQIYTDIVTVLRVILVNIWLIVLMAVILGAGAFFLTQLQNPVYESLTSVVIAPSLRPAQEDVLQGIDILDPDIVGTYVQILDSRTLYNRALEVLKTTYSEDQFEDVEMDVRPIENSTVIVITVRAGDPNLASDIANTVVQVAIENETVRAFERSFPMSVLDPAEPEPEAVSPQTRTNLVMGVAAGAGLGVAAAFVLDTFVKARRRKNQ